MALVILWGHYDHFNDNLTFLHGSWSVKNIVSEASTVFLSNLYYIPPFWAKKFGKTIVVVANKNTRGYD
jgi:hypothetical protein